MEQEKTEKVEEKIEFGPQPQLSFTSERTLYLCKHLPLVAGDVFICSYPKSGTTWMQNIVLTLLSGGKPDFNHLSDLAPFFEVDPLWEGDELNARIVKNQTAFGRRVFNTHLRWDLLPTNPCAGVRYIYMMRDGRDAAWSFFNHLSNMTPDCYEGTWDDFYSEWLKGKIPSGGWFTHLRSWLTPEGQARDPRVLLLSYGDMKKDILACVKRVARHLGVKMSDDELRAVLPLFTFEQMNKNPKQFQPISVKWKNNFEFMRKGKVGDHCKSFSPAQIRAFTSMLRGEFADYNLPPCIPTMKALLQETPNPPQRASATPAAESEQEETAIDA